MTAKRTLATLPPAATVPENALRPEPLHCVHRMPFGPRPLSEHGLADGYRFRLWAPEEKNVEVCLFDAEGNRICHPSTKQDGWHECSVPDARPGDRYAFLLDGQFQVPDPASRFNPNGVDGPSLLLDPAAFEWEPGWHGRPWHEAVIYELHVGAFTREGTFAAAEARLPELAELGITAVELMPVGDFPGERGWGYDGVLPFAPKARYGTPDELKRFIQCAHRHGLMVFLDVVYNHFGPEGNWLHVYAPQFFSARYDTPWGAAIDFEGSPGGTVREFFIHNALYWLEEYRFDGLRLDAVHSIFDHTNPDFLQELSARVRAQLADRHVHLVVEDARNTPQRLGPPGRPGTFDAQWNDDFHHAAHVILTGETDGYYADFAERPEEKLVRCLSEGFAFQGEDSAFHDGPRGDSSAGLPFSAFVNFLQNHDQIGNRPLGERLAATVDPQRLRALVAVLLLAPSPPLIFMGEEAGATTPFLYFSNLSDELGVAIREGRSREFAHFIARSGGVELPDPCAEESFLRSRLDRAVYESPQAEQWLGFYREMLALRHELVVPIIPHLLPGRCLALQSGPHAFEVRWVADKGEALVLRANLSDSESPSLADLGVAPFAAVGPYVAAERLGPWSVYAYMLRSGSGTPPEFHPLPTGTGMPGSSREVGVKS